MLLPLGTEAPDFELFATPDQKIKLSELMGRRVILLFYPADWSPVCGDEVVLFNETLSFFSALNAVLLAISVDSKWCHMAFSLDRKLHYPLLADFEPKGFVSKQYGVYNTVEGQCRRALFLIDEHGIIQWSYISPDALNPGVSDILNALENLDKRFLTL